MTVIDVLARSAGLEKAWASTAVGQAAGANIKVLRMDEAAYAAESHDFTEALLVLEGCMRLEIDDKVVEVQAGQLYLVPQGVPHAVAPGSHGTLLIIDPPPNH
ncbi:cupin domain-containing protein [Rhodoferax aquaticus]|uniref:Cupin domain-containing protein n=1 Tax=Rhodoferax aquaticus TaxID=2527691 RepID=A0A515ERA9_9BURK|nr:cupin domain-containing protein [Rhodoferax aquaticus]QDL55204.1 cupin domain-containing protein [Rhodoferax aquaticus]